MFGLFESDEVKGEKEKTVKELQATIKRLQTDAIRAAERVDDREHSTRRAHEREILELELSQDDAITELTRYQSKRYGELGSKILVLERAARDKEKNNQLAIDMAVQECKSRLAVPVETAAVALAKSQGETKVALETATAKDQVIAAYVEQNEEYQELIETLILKIPDVKLDKFNVNVDVPAQKQEITVVK